MGASDLGALKNFLRGSFFSFRSAVTRTTSGDAVGGAREGFLSSLTNCVQPPEPGHPGMEDGARRQDTPPRGVSGFLQRSMKTRRGRTSPPVLTVPTTASGSRGAPPLDERSRAGEGSRQDRPVTSG